MLFVNYKIDADRETVLSNLKNNDRVVSEENFDLSKGKPKMHIKEKGDLLKIKCEMTERATKDNGFLEGTYFIGRLKMVGDTSKISGVIVTAPIYHTIFLILFLIVIVQAIMIGGIPITGIFLIFADIIMFSGEFKKQPLIKRYIFRALKITYKMINNK